VTGVSRIPIELQPFLYTTHFDTFTGLHNILWRLFSSEITPPVPGSFAPTAFGDLHQNVVLLLGTIANRRYTDETLTTEAGQ
jgi:hypothetical protein